MCWTAEKKCRYGLAPEYNTQTPKCIKPLQKSYNWSNIQILTKKKKYDNIVSNH